jgi:hypothetical protein
MNENDDFDTSPSLPPTEPKRTPMELAIGKIMEYTRTEVLKLEERYDRELELLRADIRTVYNDLLALQRDHAARFGTQRNCPKCTKKLDARANRTHCPFCSAPLV